MLDDPRDRSAYRIAVTMLGLALIIAIAGVCWVAAAHSDLKGIPSEIWFLPAGIGGVFVGMLIPLPFYHDKGLRVAVGIYVCLIFVGVCTVAIGIWNRHHHESLAICAVAVTISAVLLGLPIPSPGRRDR